MNVDFVETSIKERHEYARHVFTSTINWFSFFVVLNYGAMSWLAGSDKLKGDPRSVILVASGFIAQNILGIIACLIVRRYFARSETRLLEAQAILLKRKSIPEDLSDLSGQTCLPRRLYSTVIALMIVALVPILVAWAVLIQFVIHAV